MKRSFAAADSGAIAPIMALGFVMLCAFAGLAVDYSRATNTRQNLQAATDAAALALASRPEAGSVSKEALAKAYLDIIKPKFLQVTFGEPTVGISPDGTEFTVETTAKMPTHLMRVLGVQDLEMKLRSKAAVSSKYLDIYLVLDISESMLRAATQSESDRLKAISKPYTDAKAPDWPATENGCAFACHARSGSGFEPAGKTMKDLAVESNVLLRTDVMVTAAKALAQDVLDPQNSNRPAEMVRIGVLAFDSMAYNIGAPSTDLNVVKNNLDEAIDSMRAYDTRYEDVMANLADMVGDSGNGQTQDTSRKVVVIATDGVKTSNLDQGTLTPGLCDNFKDRGVQVGVIDLEYFEDLSSPAYMDRIFAVYPQIKPDLKACASTLDMYFAGREPAQIRDAFNKMADEISNRNVRLTQ